MTVGDALDGAESGSFEQLPSQEPFRGVSRRSFDSLGSTVNRYSFAPGASFPLHSHKSEQVTLITEGSVEMMVEGEVTNLAKGDWSIVPGGLEHGITAGPEGAAVIAVVTPRRQRADDYELSGGRIDGGVRSFKQVESDA